MADQDLNNDRSSGRQPVSVWTRVACVAFSAGIGVIGSEVMLRAQEPLCHLMARHYNQHAQYIAHPIWDHWPRPNSTVVRATMDPTRYPRLITYTTNRDGCRYPRDVAVPKPSNVARILILGDSFTEGYYDEDTIAARLEHRLNASSASVARFEVINCGSSSHSPLLYYLRLKHQLLGLEPDRVVVNIDLTDIFDDYWRYRPRMVASTSGEPLAVRGLHGPWTRTKEWLKRTFYAARVLAEVAAQRPSPPGSPDAPARSVPTPENIFAYYRDLPVESDAWKREVRFTVANLSRVIGLCREHRIPLCVTMYPYRQQLEPDRQGKRWNRAFERLVEQSCRAHGVDFYSAYHGIAAAFTKGQPIYWERDIHFTPDGQRVWSQLVAEHLQGWIQHARKG